MLRQACAAIAPCSLTASRKPPAPLAPFMTEAMHLPGPACSTWSTMYVHLVISIWYECRDCQGDGLAKAHVGWRHDLNRALGVSSDAPEAHRLASGADNYAAVVRCPLRTDLTVA